MTNYITGTDVDRDALATNLRDLADGIAMGTVSVQATDERRTTATEDVTEATISLSYAASDPRYFDIVEYEVRR